MSLLLALMFACGTERWTVKVMSDPAVMAVSLAPHYTTIAAIKAVSRHHVGPATPRIAGLETLWDLRVVVCLVKPETDEDRHVVIGDTSAARQSKGQGSSVPRDRQSPPSTCAIPSHFRTRIRSARQAVESLSSRRVWKLPGSRSLVVGVLAAARTDL